MDVSTLIPVLHRAHRKMGESQYASIHFAGEHWNPLEWTPRELNRVADDLANECMGRQESFERWFVEQKGLKNTNVVVFTGGGVRPHNQLAAAALTIIAMVRGFHAKSWKGCDRLCGFGGGRSETVRGGSIAIA